MESVLTNKITDRYSAVDAWMYDRLFAPAVLAMVRGVIDGLSSNLPADSQVLDVGCGGGHIPLALAAQREDVRITGIDLCPPQLRRAERRCRDLAGRVDFVEGSALDLPFEPARFDAVVSITSIKHWPSQSDGLNECIRVLKPGGQLVVVEVDRGCTLDDVRAILRASRVPRFLRPVFLPFIRTFIIGQGIDLEESRTLLAALPLEDGYTGRINGMGGLLIKGRLRLA